MRILLVNHTGAVSGAELSLMRLVEGLRRDHRVAVAAPSAGPLRNLVEQAGVERYSVPAFEASLRPHPVQTPAGVVRLGAGGVAVARVARRYRAEMLHANTARAGLMGAIARRLGGPPLVVRAHEHVPLTSVGRAVRLVLIRSAGAVVAVSRDVAQRLDEGLEQPVATFVYNSIDHRRFDPHRVEPSAVREELGIDARAPLLGQVAQITPWKGQDTAVRALAELRRGGVEAHLLLVGEVVFAGKSVRHDNRAFLRHLKLLVQDLAVGDAVHFLGQRPDVPALLQALDLSLLPSWNEPFGMVTVESMAMGTPPLVSGVGGGPELVEDRVSGRLLSPTDPGAWAAAARELLDDRASLARMGSSAQAAAARFRDDVQAREMLAVYEHVLARPPQDRPVTVA